jgi:hypothetical protein
MKKRNVFLLGLLVVLLAMGLVLVGCGDDGFGDNGSNNSGDNNSGDNNTGGDNNSGGATTGSIIFRNNTGRTIVRITVNQRADDSLLQSFSVNVPNGGNYTITNVPPGSYYLWIYDNVSGYYPVAYMGMPVSVSAGQTATVTGT